MLKRLWAHVRDVKPMRWQTVLLVLTWLAVFKGWNWLSRVAEANWLGDVLLGAASGVLGFATVILSLNRLNEWLGKRQAIRDDASSVWPPPAPPQT